jgi:hypothetical protein
VGVDECYSHGGIFMVNLQNRIAKAKNDKQTGNMIEFNNVECIYLGAPAIKYYEKLEDGTKSKDQSGWTLLFSELGTSKVVKYVYKTQQDAPNLVGGQLYSLSGLGYDFKQNMTLYIAKATAFDVIKD